MKIEKTMRGCNNSRKIRSKTNVQRLQILVLPKEPIYSKGKSIDVKKDDKSAAVLRKKYIYIKRNCRISSVFVENENGTVVNGKDQNGRWIDQTC